MTDFVTDCSFWKNDVKLLWGQFDKWKRPLQCGRKICILLIQLIVVELWTEIDFSFCLTSPVVFPKRSSERLVYVLTFVINIMWIMWCFTMKGRINQNWSASTSTSHQIVPSLSWFEEMSSFWTALGNTPQIPLEGLIVFVVACESHEELPMEAFALNNNPHFCHIPLPQLLWGGQDEREKKMFISMIEWDTCPIRLRKF